MALRELRERANICQVDVARKLSADQAAVSKWENGINPPHPKYRKRLAKLYDCTVDDLLKPGREEGKA